MSQPSLRRPIRDYESAIDTACRIYSGVRDSCIWSYESIHESTFHPSISQKVVGLAFMGLLAAWEEFVEETFLRYLAGAASPDGFSPGLRVGRCGSRAHALQVLAASRSAGDAARRTRWNDYRWVIEVSNLYFKVGAPFKRVPARFVDRLSDAVVIRNRVVHNSTKARRAFKAVVNKAGGDPVDSPLPRGLSPGRFLVGAAPAAYFDDAWIADQEHFWGDTFEAYVSMFAELRSILAP